MIQRRGDYGWPRVDFHRNWNDYKHGFGIHNKEFWLGNEQILTEPKMLTKKVKIDSYILKISTKSILDQ